MRIIGVLIFIISILSLLIMNHCEDQENRHSNFELSDINHIIHMGQSLGAGEQSLPIVTDESTGFGNLKFEIGTHTWSGNYYPDKPELRGFENFSFVPLIAQQRGAEGETIANGMCDHLSHTINDHTLENYCFLFSYAGQGGRYLRELDKRHDDAKDSRASNRMSGGGYYKTSIDDVRRAKSTADSLKKSYSVFGITWMQGEAEGGLKVNRWDAGLSREATIATYKRDLIQLKEDYQNDIKSITGQEDNIPFFTYQTFGSISGTGQLMACDQEEDMYMVGPTYMLPNAENSYYFSKNKLVHGDGIHLTADGERWLGEQFGKVMRKVIIEGKEWKPLRPLEAWYDKNRKAVFIRYQVPEVPIVIDTSFLPKQDTGLGFRIYDEKNQDYSIKEVDIVGDDTVQILLENILPTKGVTYVSYGLLSKVSDLSRPIQSITSGMEGEDGHESIEVVFEGNILDEVNVIGKEGVYYLNNNVADENDFTNLIIRKTYLDKNGNTVFKGEIDDLRASVMFKRGQKCYTSRRFAFGNIRDSDTEKSTFRFKDTTYGVRQGHHYPLYNWGVIFQDLRIDY